MSTLAFIKAESFAVHSSERQKPFYKSFDLFFHCLVCQLIAGGVPEPTSQAIPARIRKAVKVKPSSKRTLKIRLLPKGGAERKLSYELMSAIGLEAQE